MRLKAYLSRTRDMIFSRRGLTIEFYEAVELQANHAAIIEGRLRFWDGSMLRFREELVEEGVRLNQKQYVYHYQAQDSSLIFRYDNVPHYPHLPTHPHHKHVRVGADERVEAAQPPQLTDVLREIEALLTSSTA